LTYFLVRSIILFEAFLEREVVRKTHLTMIFRFLWSDLGKLERKLFIPFGIKEALSKILYDGRVV